MTTLALFVMTNPLYGSLETTHVKFFAFGAPYAVSPKKDPLNLFKIFYIANFFNPFRIWKYFAHIQFIKLDDKII